MARKPRVFIEGGIYHITCRENDRRNIFKGDEDRIRFLERLGESAQTYGIRIYLFCLMTNHVHLLAETPHGNLDRFMGSLLTYMAGISLVILYFIQMTVSKRVSPIN
jgi:REP element-mobilizing transposase RayT